MKKRVGGEPGKEIMVLDVIDKKGEHHCMEIRRRITRQGDKIIVHGSFKYSEVEKKKSLALTFPDGSRQRV